MKSFKRPLLFGVLLLVTVAIGLIGRYRALLPSTTQTKTQAQAVNWQAVRIDTILVQKHARKLHVMQEGRAIKTYAIRLGFQPLGHKTTEGDGKTPEGTYTLDWRNPNSQFYKSLHISYPNTQDLAQAQARGVSAGGDVMVHGSSNLPQGNPNSVLYNYLPQNDWTHGCISVSNQDMDELWVNVKNGTPIIIQP